MFYNKKNVEHFDEASIALLKEQLSQYNNRQFISDEQQKQIQKSLDNSIKTYSAKGGAVIVMDADNSQILSMYSVHNGEEIFNYVFDYKYEPGSTYMPFVVAIGLERGAITEDTVFVDLSKLIKKGCVIDSNLENKTIRTEDILALGLSTSSAKISADVGSQKHLRFLSAIGFDKEVSLGHIKTEKTVLPKNFNKPSLRNAGMGFGFKVTPLHLITAYASLVNGGVYHAPFLDKPVKNNERYVISAENSQRMRKYLRKVVTEGSVGAANVKNVNFMAKTGTISKVIDGKYDAEHVTTDVVGNFEYKNTHYVVFVLLDEPEPTKETSGFRTAGWNALPVIKEIISIITEENKPAQ